MNDFLHDSTAQSDLHELICSAGTRGYAIVAVQARLGTSVCPYTGDRFRVPTLPLCHTLYPRTQSYSWQGPTTHSQSLCCLRAKVVSAQLPLNNLATHRPHPRSLPFTLVSSSKTTIASSKIAITSKGSSNRRSFPPFLFSRQSQPVQPGPSCDQTPASTSVFALPPASPRDLVSTRASLEDASSPPWCFAFVSFHQLVSQP